MIPERRNQLRKKIENYSYGLNDYLNFARRSNIFKGINEATSQIVAIKVVDLRNKEAEVALKEQLSVQIDALKKLNHPNIVKCLDIYSTVNNCYIITEFCDGGDIENRINNRGAFKESEALSVFRDLMTGYTFIVNEKFVHGGLKPSSLLLKDNMLKIGGFSNCRKILKTDVKRDIPYNSYQSPESVKQGIFNQKSDVWSLGMILYVMLHGKSPWEITNPNDLLEAQLKPFPISSDLSEDVRQVLRLTLVAKTTRISFDELRNHRLIKRLMSNHFPLQKYVPIQEIEQKSKKVKDAYQHQISKVQRQISCQINWMRFLFRLIDRFGTVPQENSSFIVKFIILRQISVQYYNLKLHVQKGQNAFGFSSWEFFVKQTQKMAKYLDVFKKYQLRYDKIVTAYQKLLERLYLSQNNCKGLTQILDKNFALSEYNCIFALGASISEIKRFWQKITKDYSPKGKYTSETPFKYRFQLLLIDFLVTYYQLNCLLVEDFHRMDYFQKMSKLEIILEYLPAELDASNLEEVEAKLKQLSII